jgi:hypothetical protein
VIANRDDGVFPKGESFDITLANAHDPWPSAWAITCAWAHRWPFLKPELCSKNSFDAVQA